VLKGSLARAILAPLRLLRHPPQSKPPARPLTHIGKVTNRSVWGGHKSCRWQKKRRHAVTEKGEAVLSFLYSSPKEKSS